MRSEEWLEWQKCDEADVISSGGKEKEQHKLSFLKEVYFSASAENWYGEK